MIVSFDRNFIFVKSRKTAGTSMEIALATHAGENDIITPLAKQDELIRLKIDSASLPRNYLIDPKAEESYRAAVRRGDTSEMKRLRKGFADYYKFYNHASARQARKRLDPAMWDSAFKFTIERHPYEKAVSMAWLRLGSRTFAEALDDTIARGKYRNFDLYTIDGTVAVDFIIRYEQLAQDVKSVEEKLGIEILSRLPAAKASSRSDRRPAAEVLTEAQKIAIRKVCAEEFVLMGYAE